MKSRLWIALFALYIAWGTTYLAIRFAVESLPPFLMASTRFLIAGLIVYIWRRLAGDPAPSRRQWRSAALIGSLLLVTGNGILCWAEQRVPSGIAALIVAAIPLWVVLLDAVRPGGSLPTWRSALSVLVGIAGLILLAAPSASSSGQPALDLLGVSALLFAAFSWAVGTVFGRQSDMPTSLLLGSGMEMLAASGGLFLFGILTGELGRLDLTAVTLRSLLGLAYLIVVGSLIGFVSYSWLLRLAPTSLVVTHAYVNPLVAVVLGSLLASETLTPRILIAAPLILSAVALTHWTRPKVRPSLSARLAVPAVSAGED